MQTNPITVNLPEEGGSIILDGYDTHVFKNSEYGDLLIFANDYSSQRVLIGLCNYSSNSMITVHRDHAQIEKLKVMQDAQVGGDLIVNGQVSFCNPTVNVKQVQNSEGPVNVNGVLMSNQIVIGNIATSNIFSPDGGAIKIEGTYVTSNALYSDTIYARESLTSNLYVQGVITVSSNIVPDTDDKHSIGMTGKRFSEMHLGKRGMHIGGTRIVNAKSNIITLLDSETMVPTGIQVRDIDVQDRYAIKLSPSNDLRFYRIQDGGSHVLDTAVPGLFSDMQSYIGIGTQQPQERLSVQDGDISISSTSESSKVVLSARSNNTLIINENVLVKNSLNVPHARIGTLNACNQNAELLHVRDLYASNVTVSEVTRSASIVASNMTASNASITSIKIPDTMYVSTAHASNLHASVSVMSNLTIQTRMNASNAYIIDSYHFAVTASNITAGTVDVDDTLTTDLLLASNVDTSNVITDEVHVAKYSCLNGVVESTGMAHLNFMTASNANVTGTLVSHSYITASNITASSITLNTLNASRASVHILDGSNLTISNSLRVITNDAVVSGMHVGSLYASSNMFGTVSISNSLDVPEASISNLSSSNITIKRASISNLDATFINVTSNLTTPVAAIDEKLNISAATVAYPNYIVLPDQPNLVYFENLAKYTGPTEVSSIGILSTPSNAISPNIREGHTPSVHRYLELQPGCVLTAAPKFAFASQTYTIGVAFKIDEPLAPRQSIKFLKLDFDHMGYSIEWEARESFGEHQVVVTVVNSTLHEGNIPCVQTVSTGKWNYVVFVKDLGTSKDIRLYLNTAESPVKEINIDTDINTQINAISRIWIGNDGTSLPQKIQFGTVAIYNRPEDAYAQGIIDFMAAKTTVRTYSVFAASNLTVGALVPNSMAALDVIGDINLTGKIYMNNKLFRQTPFIPTPDGKNVYSSGSNVGINTQNPTSALDVVGNVDASSFSSKLSGSAGDPSYTWNVASDTGLYLASSNAIAFTCSGSNVMTLVKNQLVTPPIATRGTVDVGGDLNFAGALLRNGKPYKSSQFNTSVDQQTVYLADSNVVIGASTGSPSNALSVYKGAFVDRLTVGGDIDLGGKLLNNGKLINTSQFMTASNNRDVYILDSNVGIGTSQPASGFHVVGDTTLEGGLRTSKQMQITGLRIGRTNPTGTPMTVTSTVTSIPGFANGSNSINFTLCNTQHSFKFMRSNYDCVALLDESGSLLTSQVSLTPLTNLLANPATLSVTGFRAASTTPHDLEVLHTGTKIGTIGKQAGDIHGHILMHPLAVCNKVVATLTPSVPQTLQFIESTLVESESTGDVTSLHKNNRHEMPVWGVYSVNVLVTSTSTGEYAIKLYKNTTSSPIAYHRQANTQIASTSFTGVFQKNDVLLVEAMSTVSSTADVIVRVVRIQAISL